MSLYAYCLARAGNRSLAQQTIDQAVRADSGHALIKAVQAYVGYNTQQKPHEHGEENKEGLEQFDFATHTAVKANISSLYSLPYIVRAKFCEITGDWDCMIDNWSLIQLKEPLSAYGGIAYARYQKKEYDIVRRYLKMGLQKDHDRRHKPLRLVSIFIKSRMY